MRLLTDNEEYIYTSEEIAVGTICYADETLTDVYQYGSSAALSEGVVTSLDDDNIAIDEDEDKIALRGEIVEIESPYDSDDLPYLKRTQAGDLLTLTDMDYPALNLTRYSHYDWVLEEIVFEGIHGTKWKQRVFTDIMKTEFDVLIGVSDNIPVCMGGAWHLDKDEDDFAVMWMLSTDEVINHKISLLRKLKELFCEYDKKYKYFYNFIYSKNRDAKKWLKWLGFKFDKPRPLGLDIPEGFEFFYRVKG